ncbi:ATP-dependent DNA helicase PIF1-like [Saccostrea echinata]|uniref:ATP-dependent DNA helicase PIF1-like n=1 Tax=Saccostrea echinata TaxID=191078 RepID=UPI002A818D89|nr:ATP-dependent DNA helicase PIF1-like [Saccostrea echinata]
MERLQCTLAVEELSKAGDVQKSSIHKNIFISVGRNEFRDVVLKVELQKKDLKFSLRELRIHKKFAKDGKSTIRIPDKNMNLLISNCPPDKLIYFLKLLSTKFECGRLKGFISERKKLLSDVPKSFEEISPLTIKDLKTVHEARAKELESKPDMFTPKGKGVGKRKRSIEDDKENRPVQKSKFMCSSLNPSAIAVPVKLSKEQNTILDAVLQGKNVFFTGSAGTGKSFLMRRIIGSLPPQHTFATASTGVAACHIGGTTLHAFAGIGSGSALLEQCVQLASRPQIAQQWRKCHHLVIDEISMVDGSLFDKLETIARVVRKNDNPFGGIQLIICGDFLQLPPVTKGTEKKTFCFQAKSWSKCIQVNMELKEVRRQNDISFINILQNVRLGKCSEETYQVLRETAQHNIQRNGILATRLCTHKEDVNKINLYHLGKLQGDEKTFVALDGDEVYQSQLEVLSPVPKKLNLKVGAQVMLAKNLEVQRGLVNGARGVVVGFDKKNQDYPVVKFVSGEEEVIRPVRWTFKLSGTVYINRKQLPLKLAWAISIHKSQGMTLDCVEMSLSKVFEAGQTYVALSRAKSLEGLRILDFDRSCVHANPDVLRFYHKLELTRKMMQTSIDDCW